MPAYTPTHRFTGANARSIEYELRKISQNISGDITGVTAGVGLSGGGTSGNVTLTLDVSELSALGTDAALTDYVIIQDVTDDSSKKVLVTNLPATWS